MPTLLSDDEIAAMDGLPYLHRDLYIFGIRRYMDYATGIAGVKRRISWQSLRESLYVEPHQGRISSGSPSKDQVRRAAEFIENKGLVKKISEDRWLIFECLLATKGQSAQNKPAINPPHHPATPEASTGNGLDGKPATPKSEKPAIPLVSDIYTDDDIGAWKNFFVQQNLRFKWLTDANVNRFCCFLVNEKLTQTEVMQIMADVNNQSKAKTISSPCYYEKAVMEYVEAKKNPIALSEQAPGSTTRGGNYETGKRTRQQELNEATAARAARSFEILQQRKERNSG